MISYEPLWNTMKQRGISTYLLINDYGFSRGTLDSLKQGRNVTVSTIDMLCSILSCNVEDIMQHIPDKK